MKILTEKDGNVFEYEIVGDSLKKIRPFSDIPELDTLTIPSGLYDNKGVYHPIKSIGARVLRTKRSGYSLACTEIDNLIIEDGIIEIADNAFEKTHIKKVRWSKSVVTIPSYCFKESTLSEIENVESVEVLKDFAFYGCYELRSLKSFSALKEVGQFAFSNNCLLKEAVLPDTVEKIGARAFNKCFSLMEFTWPSACTTIQDMCFASCHKLASISNIDHVTKIGFRAFSSCAALKRIELPQNITILSEAFRDSGLVSMNWPNSNDIPSGCFSGCKGLEYITGIENVSLINEKAFYNCESLKTFSWPSKCRHILAATFDRCYSLEKIDGLEHVTLVSAKAFADCSLLHEINLPDTVSEIGFGAFRDTGVKEFRWPSGCKHIPDCCFWSSVIESITNIDEIISIGDNAFYNCRSLKSFTAPVSLTRIGEDAFGSCKNIEKLDLSAASIFDIDVNKISYAHDLNLDIVSLPYYCSV